MTKETKQDVFDDLLTEAYGYSVHKTDTYGRRYSAATPCELPVIPAKLAKMMKAGHEIHADLWTIMNIIAKNLTDQETLDWYFTHGDEFALAWLLNNWEVKD